MAEHTVSIPDHIISELMPMLEEEGKDVSEFVAEALRRYLWEARERKIDQEMTAYRAMHSELKQRLLGEYVAIHHGKLVDHDPDRNALSSRVRQRYGNAALLITPVQVEAEREFLMLSPRWERGA
jgi:hypothetical protein